MQSSCDKATTSSWTTTTTGRLRRAHVPNRVTVKEEEHWLCERSECESCEETRACSHCTEGDQGQKEQVLIRGDEWGKGHAVHHGFGGPFKKVPQDRQLKSCFGKSNGFQLFFPTFRRRYITILLCVTVFQSGMSCVSIKRNITKVTNAHTPQQWNSHPLCKDSARYKKGGHTSGKIKQSTHSHPIKNMKRS